MSWMRRLKPPPAAPQQPAGPVRPHVVAVLPWLLVATGPLLPADLPVVATEYGLNVVAHLRLRIAAHRHIAVPGAPAGTPLMDLLQCICALHRSGSSVGLSDATGAAAARKAVLLYCTAHPARWAPQVATLVVAYLHLVARLGLHESAAKVARLLRTPPDLVRDLSRAPTTPQCCSALAPTTQLRRQAQGDVCVICSNRGGSREDCFTGASHASSCAGAAGKAVPQAGGRGALSAHKATAHLALQQRRGTSVDVLSHTAAADGWLSPWRSRAGRWRLAGVGDRSHDSGG